jgi:hypothetical protein
MQVTLYRTRQLISAPILYKGKLRKSMTEVINKISLDRFTREDGRYLAEICKVLGPVLQNQSRMVCRPTKLDLLLSQHVLSEEDLNQAIARLVNDLRGPKTALAKSYEAYYRVPFVSFGTRSPRCPRCASSDMIALLLSARSTAPRTELWPTRESLLLPTRSLLEQQPVGT